MKNQTVSKIVVLALVCAGLGLVTTARAAHFTNYLDQLVEQVAFIQTNAPDDLTKSQESALNAATSILNKESKTLSTDLKALTSAATVLDRAFTNDEFTVAEQATFDQFAADAGAQLDAVHVDADLFTNGLPKNVSNALAQADAAYIKAGTNDQGVASASKDLSYALNKIRVAALQVSKSIKAPASLDGKTVSGVLKEDGEKKAVKFTLNDDGTYTLPLAAGDEEGTWTYNRDTANTGTITLSGGGGHALSLTFKNTKKATFTDGDNTGTLSIK